MKLHIVLVEPEIPQNTGNIARTCAATGAHLHLVHPLGFSTDDRYLKRAGLDYWEMLTLSYHPDLEQFLDQYRGKELFYTSKKATKIYTQVAFPEESFLLFGKETAGLPEDLLQRHEERSIRIPMVPGARSLNLSNAVAIVAFHALGQYLFPGLI